MTFFFEIVDEISRGSGNLHEENSFAIACPIPIKKRLFNQIFKSNYKYGLTLAQGYLRKLFQIDSKVSRTLYHLIETIISLRKLGVRQIKGIESTSLRIQNLKSNMKMQLLILLSSSENNLTNMIVRELQETPAIKIHSTPNHTVKCTKTHHHKHSTPQINNRYIKDVKLQERLDALPEVPNPQTY